MVVECFLPEAQCSWIIEFIREARYDSFKFSGLQLLDIDVYDIIKVIVELFYVRHGCFQQ
jgi:hypothetical protein